jgi:hypothetical protein
MIHSLISTRSAVAIGFTCLTASLHAAPQWIWTQKDAKDGETATFRTHFNLTGAVKSAKLNFTCDNGATAWLNGSKLAKNPNWDKPTQANVKKSLKPGDNELRFDATNEGPVAGLVATLEIQTMDGKTTVIESSGDWTFAPAGSNDFKPVTVIAEYGAAPWGKAFDNKDEEAVVEGSEIQVVPGFSVELLYTVPKEQQGSWVAMTEDNKGRLITSDQYGGIYRVTLLPPGKEGEPKVEALKLPDGKNGKPLGGAHGLLYAFDSLYLMNNEMADKGLWRLKDTDGDDQFDKAEYLRKCDGGSEHGTHGIVLGPDGKSIFFVNGNHTKLPENLDYIRPTAIGTSPFLGEITYHQE